MKDKYGLWVKPVETDVMERVLGVCEGFPAVAEDDAWPANGGGDVVATSTQQTPDPAPAPIEESGSGGGPERVLRPVS